MVSFETGIFVRVVELENGPKPLPLQNGFSASIAYRTLGIYNPSETSDAYLILANDRDELWFICNRHLRVYGLLPEQKDLRMEVRDRLVQVK